MAIVEYLNRRSQTVCGFGLALFVGLGATGCVLPLSIHAQSTTGHIFGQAPAGETVIAQSNNGMNRHITVDSSGRYSLRNLPLSVYKVSLVKDGKVVDTRNNIPMIAARGMEVDFACPNDHCAEASKG